LLAEVAGVDVVTVNLLIFLFTPERASTRMHYRKFWMAVSFSGMIRADLAGGRVKKFIRPQCRNRLKTNN